MRRRGLTLFSAMATLSPATPAPTIATSTCGDDTASTSASQEQSAACVEDDAARSRASRAARCSLLSIVRSHLFHCVFAVFAICDVRGKWTQQRKAEGAVTSSRV